jgi:pentatricopeptide repeat protein
MRAARVAPDTVTLNTLVAGWVATGHLATALDLLRSMDTTGPAPNHYTFATVIGG